MSESVHRDNKARLFSFIFGREENKRWTLQLYNAANGTDYSNPDEIEINTIEEVIYMGMHNDLSFIMHSDLSLYEHQSSYNPNMPVRQLMYLARLYDKYIKKTSQNIYGEKLMTLPAPTKVYPGHGPMTTIETEANYNPYLYFVQTALFFLLESYYTPLRKNNLKFPTTQ